MNDKRAWLRLILLCLAVRNGGQSQPMMGR